MDCNLLAGTQTPYKTNLASSCMWIPVYSQQLTMFVWILNVICVVVVGCFAVAGSVCRFISSFYQKHLISWNITISQVFLTILRFSFFTFTSVSVNYCSAYLYIVAVGLLLCLLYSARVFYCMCNEIRRDKIFRRTSNSTNTLERVSIIFTTCGDRV